MRKQNIFLLALLTFACIIPAFAFSQVTTNFPNGVTNVGPQDPFNKITFPLSIDYIQVFDDFNDFSTMAGASLPSIAAPLSSTQAYSAWSSSTVGTSIVAIENSTMSITTGATDNNRTWYMGRETTVYPRSGKELYFEALINFASASADTTESEFVCGLIGKDITPIDSLTGGVWFQKDDGQDTFTFKVGSVSAISTATPSVTIVEETDYKLSFYYDGKSSITYSINDIPYGIAGITNLPTNSLSAEVGIKTGTSSAIKLDIDYIYAAIER